MARQRSSAVCADNEEHELEEDGDAGAAIEDLPTRCFHCSFPEGVCYNVLIATSSHACDAFTDVGLNAAGNLVVATDPFAGNADEAGKGGPTLQLRPLGMLLPLPNKLGLLRGSLRHRGCGSTALEDPLHATWAAVYAPAMDGLARLSLRHVKEICRRLLCRLDSNTAHSAVSAAQLGFAMTPLGTKTTSIFAAAVMTSTLELTTLA